MKRVLKWYFDNGVLDFAEEQITNHFEIFQDKKNSKIEIKQIKKSGSFGVKSRNIDEVVNLLALKYKNKNSNNNLNNSDNLLTPQEAIKMARKACEKIETLKDLKEAIENFEGCYSIKKLATNTVFGEGNEKANILIIGEAPGNNEDLQGRPFCGQSGILLEKMFQAIGHKREDMYITNTLFWRPPGNRTPTPEELAMCKPFVEKHIALINPKIIIMMGSTALKGLIDTNEGITRSRRKMFEYKNPYLEKSINATALFHPSYLLRRPIKKRDTWKDLLIIKEFLNKL